MVIMTKIKNSNLGFKFYFPKIELQVFQDISNSVQIDSIFKFIRGNCKSI